MRQQLTQFAIRSGLAFCVALGCSSVSFGVADLTGWVGQNNTPGVNNTNNNYTVISPTSVGGTFESRIAPIPPNPPPENWYLRDPTLVGGPLGFDDSLAMSGKITVANPNNADPSMFFGWYSSTDIRFRIGFSMADSAANIIRLQANYGNGGTITSANLTTNNSNTGTFAQTPAPGGGATYDFTFAYTPGLTNNLQVHIDPLGSDWRRTSINVNFATADKFDRFGFLQLGASPATASTTTLGVTFSDISYTGEGAVSLPVPGDYNGNGTVDTADYVLYRDGSLAADGTGPSSIPDGVVDGLDYDFWKARFGNTSGSGAAVVPEPATCGLLILALIAVTSTHRRKGS